MNYSKDQINDFLSKDGRICPNPEHWSNLYSLIRSDLEKNKLAPLILAAWGFTSDFEKKVRLKEQIDFVFTLSEDKQNRFFNYLLSISDSNWHIG